MNKKINIGVFPCGSEVGLEIHRALTYIKEFSLIGLNSTTDYGEVVYKNYIGNLPFIGEENFIFKLKKLIHDNNIEFLIPTMDAVGTLIKGREKEIGCEIVYCDYETAKIIQRKSSTYAAIENEVNTPTSFDSIGEAIQNLPVFSKPDIGYGSRNTELINSKERLEIKWKEQNDLLFLEYLPGREYTIDCFSDLSNNLLFAGVRERIRTRIGISVSSKSEKIPILEQWAKKISKVLQMKGVWFFQVKESKNGEFKLLEVASRVSGSMSLYRVRGVNFIALDLFQRLGNIVSILEFLELSTQLNRSFNCSVSINYSFDTVYVDYDDCLIIEDKVNSVLVAFLYEQINEDKKIILISRHKGNLLLDLERRRLGNIFDVIHHIENPTISKSQYMKSKNAIFIDDSFRERADVFKLKKIPTFAPDAIPALIK